LPLGRLVLVGGRDEEAVAAAILVEAALADTPAVLVAGAC
jgi:hypothetical protein